MRLLLRIGLIALGVIIVLIAGVLILALNSSFQTNMARKVLKGQAEEMRLEKVDAGLNGVKIEDFYFKSDQGLVVKLKEADIQIDLLDAALSDEVRIPLLYATELQIDISGLQPTEPETAEKDSAGEVEEKTKKSKPSEIKIPLLSVEKVDIDNVRLILSEDRHIDLKLEGGNIEPGKTGTLNFTINFSDETEAAKIAQADLKGRIEVGQTEEENFDFALILIDPSKESEDEIFHFKSRFNQSESTITGSSTLNLNQANLKDFLEDTELPGFGFQSEFDIAFEDQSLTLNTLKAAITDAQNQSIIDLQNLKTVQIDLKAGEPNLEKISGDLIKLKIENLEVDWFAPFLPNLALSSDTISGEFTISQKERTIGFVSNEPFSIKNISLAQEDKPLLSEIDFLFEPQIDFDLEQQSAIIQLKQLNLSSERSSILEVEAEFDLKLPKGKDPLELASKEINITVDLPQLFLQPGLAARVSEIASGELTVQGDLTWGITPTADFVINLSELKSTAALKSEINSLNVKIKAKQEEDGTFMVEIPTKLIGSEGASDIDLNLSYKTNEGEDDTFDLKATSKQIVVVDFQSLAQAFSPPQSDPETDPFETAPSTPSSSDPPEKALWAGYQGQVQAELDKILLPDAQVLRDLRAKLKVDPDQIEIETLRVNLDPSLFKMEGTVAFEQGTTRPYDLKSNFELKDFDVGEFLKKTNPEQPPAMEAVVSVSGDVTGQWLNPNDLSQTAQGQFLFTSKNGTIRPFEQGKASSNTTLQQGSQLAQGFQQVSALFGTEVAGVKEVGEIQEILNYFEEIPFSECVIKINRAEDLDFKIEEFLIKNPELYIQGKGTITYQENVPITDLPLYIDTQLAAKNKAAELLDDIKLLTSEKDDEGFALGPRYTIKGTVGAPDYSTFYSLIETAIKGSIADKTLGSGSGALGNTTKDETETQEGEQKSGDIQDAVTDILKEAAIQGIRGLINPDSD